MRVYLPTTQTGLRELVTSGGLGPTPLLGFAVTGALREAYAEGDVEELEYVAMTAAARASLDLLAQDTDEPPRRVAVAVETDTAHPVDGFGPAAVELPQVVPLREVASVHVDTAEAEADVTAAVRVLADGGPRDDDERFVLDTCEGHELAWFATQEIGDLLA
jgi:hypothetical protein